MSLRERQPGAARADDADATAASDSKPSQPTAATAAGVGPVAAPPAPVVSARNAGRAELPEGTTIGEYRVEGRLGSGAFGTVYGGIQPLIGKRVAIKVLDMVHSVDPGMVARFVAEARAVNVIGHENIVDIFSFGELDDGRRYFVMERLDGKPLSALLKERGPLPPGEALSILAPVARALSAAHAAGIAHRDLKPDNIFLCSSASGGWRPKLLDFGVAKLLDESADQHATATGVTVGTPSYMSPEQCVGRGVDHRADIYAFGVLTHRMLAGRLPFHAGSASEMMAKHLYEAPTPLHEVRPELPRAVTDVVLAMLEKDKARRPQSVDEALAALEQATAGDDAATTPSGARRALAATNGEGASVGQLSSSTANVVVAGARSKRTAWLAIGAAVLALAAAALAMRSGSSSAPTGTPPGGSAPSPPAAAAPTTTGTAPVPPAVPTATPATPTAAAATAGTSAAPAVEPPRVNGAEAPTTPATHGPAAATRATTTRPRRGAASPPTATPAETPRPAPTETPAPPPAHSAPGDQLPKWDTK